MEISLQLVQLLVFCSVEEYLYLFIVSLATILAFWTNIVEEHRSGYMDTESEPRTFEHEAIDHFFIRGH
jgi:hypothetical protein